MLFFLRAHWAKPVDFSDEVLAQAAAQAEAFRSLPIALEPSPERAWERFAAALDDDFSTPEALAVMHEWRDHELLARALDVFGLSSLAEQAEPPAPSSLERREEARARRDFEEADRLRGEIAALGWEVRDVTDGFQLVPCDSRARLRSAAGVRGAARPARSRAARDRAGAAENRGCATSRPARRLRPNGSSRSSRAP